jgi:hypothetical protein
MLLMVMSEMRPAAALHGIERQALEILRIEFEKYQDSQILTPSLVQLIKATHDMVMKRVASTGIDPSRSPREVLVELEQLTSEVRMMVEQENEMSGLQ